MSDADVDTSEKKSDEDLLQSLEDLPQSWKDNYRRELKAAVIEVREHNEGVEEAGSNE